MTPIDLHERELALDPRQSFIVQAPAGSGKTELLTRRYLRLLSQVRHPEEILAMTFTRKAAHEMRERILNALQEAQDAKKAVIPASDAVIPASKVVIPAKAGISSDSQEDSRFRGNDNENEWNGPSRENDNYTLLHLAQQALAADQKYQWHLLENPNRLKIQTIDAFCMSLVKNMPISEQVEKLYEETVEEMFAHFDTDITYAEPLRGLLKHLHNRSATAKRLLIKMLAKRDQWLPHVLSPNPREKLEQGLCHLTLHHLKKIQDYIPSLSADWLTEFEEVLAFASNHVFDLNASLFLEENKGSCHPRERGDLAGNQEIPAFEAMMTELRKKRGQALSLAHWLLTQDGTWRKLINKRRGFPSPSGSEVLAKEEKALYRSMKQRMENLLQHLSENHEELRTALAHFQVTPNMTYTEEQWSTLQNLLQLLPLAAAELRLTFQKHQEVDFIEISLAALKALEEAGGPTDLALALDYQIHHILIDEFQDTSATQFRLLEQLVIGWDLNENRSLFVVGDPMQSIYRFRRAEVGLFLQAKECGIGPIKLIPLTLHTNFRSHSSLVQWINQTFQVIFPEQDDMSLGAIRYSKSNAVIPARSPHSRGGIYPNNQEDFSSQQRGSREHENTTGIDSCFRRNDNEPGNDKEGIHNFHGQDNTAETLANIILQNRASYPKDSIAILVRNRHHLTDILPYLRSQHIPYQAVEIDPLHSRQSIQDLLALTRACLHLGDRIAWLAMLRAPWCQLSLQDLHVLATYSPPVEGWQAITSGMALSSGGGPPSLSQLSFPRKRESSSSLVQAKIPSLIWETLNNPELLNLLSPPGKEKILKFRDVLEKAFQDRKKFSLADWIKKTWVDLNGPQYLVSESELSDAELFFDKLDQISEGGDIKDFVQLETELEKLFAASQLIEENAVQVMTIHKAKGLEFDTVILPGLHSTSLSGEQELLLWSEHLYDGQTDLLLASLKALDDPEDPIYRYLQYLEKQKSNHEEKRLLYVAATRAKKRLYLMSAIDPDQEEPREGSFLKLLHDSLLIPLQRRGAPKGRGG